MKRPLRSWSGDPWFVPAVAALTLFGIAMIYSAGEVHVPNPVTENAWIRQAIWFALAGYNVGFGHLEDARILTVRAGKNPDRWADVREFLPLLTKEQYYSTVRRGYARGYEPVIYVRNIRKYLQLLTWESRVAQMRSPEESGNGTNNAKPTAPTTIAEGQSVDRIPKAL